MLGRRKDKDFPSMRSLAWTSVASDLVRLCGKNQVILIAIRRWKVFVIFLIVSLFKIFFLYLDYVTS